MTEIKSWKANDGKIFDNAKDCFLHEFNTESINKGEYYIWKDLVFLKEDILDYQFNGIFSMGKTCCSEKNEEDVFFYSFDLEGYDEECSYTLRKDDEEYKLLSSLRKQGIIEKYEED